jgi:hypothetical protein
LPNEKVEVGAIPGLAKPPKENCEPPVLPKPLAVLPNREVADEFVLPKAKVLEAAVVAVSVAPKLKVEAEPMDPKILGAEVVAVMVSCCGLSSLVSFSSGDFSLVEESIAVTSELDETASSFEGGDSLSSVSALLESVLVVIFDSALFSSEVLLAGGAGSE